jgi:hypothetical protein
VNPLSRIIDQKRKTLESGAPITQDSYDRWLDNECTKRLLAELELEILDSHLDITEENASASNAVIDALTEVLNWKPSELDKND